MDAITNFHSSEHRSTGRMWLDGPYWLLMFENVVLCYVSHPESASCTISHEWISHAVCLNTETDLNGNVNPDNFVSINANVLQ